MLNFFIMLTYRLAAVSCNSRAACIVDRAGGQSPKSDFLATHARTMLRTTQATIPKLNYYHFYEGKVTKLFGHSHNTNH